MQSRGMDKGTLNEQMRFQNASYQAQTVITEKSSLVVAKQCEQCRL